MPKLTVEEEKRVKELADAFIWKAWNSGLFRSFFRMQRRDIKELLVKDLGWFCPLIDQVTDRVEELLNNKFHIYK